MKRKEIIEQLLAIGNDNTEISITDGFEAVVYEGNFVITPYEENGTLKIDIGIGGCGLT